MVFKFVEMLNPESFVVKEFVVDTTLEREQEIILLNELKLLPRDFCFILDAQSERFYRELKNRPLRQ
jgi:hypothetical protein